MSRILLIVALVTSTSGPSFPRPSSTGVWSAVKLRYMVVEKEHDANKEGKSLHQADALRAHRGRVNADIIAVLRSAVASVCQARVLGPHQRRAAEALLGVELLGTVHEIQDRHDAARKVERSLLELHHAGLSNSVRKRTSMGGG